MKFSGLQENLKEGLNMVSHIAGKSVNLPILNNVLIEVCDSSINLISTDLEIGITNKIRGKIEIEGKYTVDAKIINDFINLLPNNKVDFELQNDELKIKCDKHQTKIKGQNAEEYPLIPKIEKKNPIIISIEEFKKALSQVAFATSNSETRLELNGILFSFLENAIYLVATDSYRLAERKINIKNRDELEAPKQNIIIPAKTAQELIRILSSVKNTEGDVKMYVNDNQALFVCESTELFSRLIEGQFPDYKQIIPENHKTEVIINRKDLIRAAKIASLFSKTGVNDVSLEIPKGQNKMIVTSASGQSGESTTEIEASVNGDDNGVVLNFRYLIDGLNNINEEFLKIKVLDSSAPCVLRGEKDEQYTYVIMPIKQ